MRAGEISAQPFTGLQLMRLDQCAAVAPAPAREPGQRAFSFIDGDAGAAEVRDDLPLRQGEMLRAEIIDDRLRRLPGRLTIFAAYRDVCVCRGRVHGLCVMVERLISFRIIYLYDAKWKARETGVTISTTFRNLFYRRCG